LIFVMRTVEGNTEFFAVGFKLRDLIFGNLIHDGQGAIVRGDAVIGSADGEIGAANFDAAFAETGEGLRRSDFVHQVQVNIQKRGRAWPLRYDVVVPHLFDNRAWLHRKILLNSRAECLAHGIAYFAGGGGFASRSEVGGDVATIQNIFHGGVYGIGFLSEAEAVFEHGSD